MSDNHVSALRTKHAELESKLEREENRPAPDDGLIHTLKKQKLALKDVIAREASPA